MHEQAIKFTVFVKEILNSYFNEKIVLDVGSGDINGNNRFLFENCSYEGNDVIQANNVTIVSKTKDLYFNDEFFDTIISTECFEHDPEYKESFLKIYKMLKPNGLFLFTCASTGRPEHGTRRTSPNNSYGTMGNMEDMIDYYKNLTEMDLNEILPLNTLFSVWDTYYNSISCDLYFVGIKNGPDCKIKSLQKFSDDGVTSTSSNLRQNEDSIQTIFDKHNTDKGSYFHNYCRQYETLFQNWREKEIKYLEIGVANGGSINAFRQLFPKATCILGLDIDNNCKKFENISKNIFIEIGDATSETFVSKFTKQYGTFDIILDDGSHYNRDVIQTFELLFPLLNDDGIYIVEDTICYKSQSHLDEKYENHLQYFFKYTPYLNQWRQDDSTEGVKDNCVDPFKILKKTKNVFEYSIDKIEYGCSYIAIHKKLRKHWIE